MLRVLAVLVGAAGIMLVPAGVDGPGRASVARARPSDTVIVPDVVDLSRSDAEAVLVDAGLEPVSSGSDADVVIDQSPVAGQVVEVGSPVSLKLAATQPVFGTVPDLQDLSAPSATALVENAGLVAVLSGPEEGVVIRQDPGPLERVPVGSSVTIVLATLVTVPDVLGTTRTEATELLRAVGLTPVSEGSDADIVVDQGRQPGEIVDSGTTVELKLAPPPDPSTPTVTPPTVTQPTVTQPTVTQPTVSQPTVTLPTVLPELITVPDLLGQEFTQARALLDDAGLVTTGEGGAGDVVIGQTPGPGARVVRDTEVRVTVAPPTPQAVVPDVQGMSWDQAAGELARSRLVIGPADGGVGTVVRQDPAAGLTVATRSVVTVELSGGGPPPDGALWYWIGGGGVIVGAVALAGGLAARPRGPRWLGSHVEVTTTLLDATVSTGQANTGQAHTQPSNTQQSHTQRDHAFEIVTRAGPGSLDLAERGTGHGSGDRS